MTIGKNIDINYKFMSTILEDSTYIVHTCTCTCKHVHANVSTKIVFT